MPRAILKQGLIYPIDPLPAEWEDGQQLWVDPLEDSDPNFAQRWRMELEALAETTEPEDDDRLQAALDEIRRAGKEEMRRKLGLGE